MGECQRGDPTLAALTFGSELRQQLKTHFFFYLLIGNKVLPSFRHIQVLQWDWSCSPSIAYKFVTAARSGINTPCQARFR